MLIKKLFCLQFLVMRVVEARGELRRFVLELASRVFSEEDVYWIREGMRWSRRWARTLVVVDEEKPLGFIQVYVWPCCGFMLGVHHYAAVVEEARGRGIGKLLIASGEHVLEEMGARIFSATLSARNRASRRMLEEMGYALYTWGELRRLTCDEAVDELLYVTGGYGDDLVALKGLGCPPEDPLRLVKNAC